MQRLKAVPKPEPTLYAPRKLDIACGQRKEPGFKGIDLAGDADITHDLFVYPWPIKTSSVAEIHCAHWVEHIPHYRPDWPKDGWWMFWEEVYRICKKGAEIRVAHPYVWNDRAFYDPTHIRFIHEITWYYLNKEWREVNSLDHYDIAADFDIITINGQGLSDEYMARSTEQQTFQKDHYKNIVGDLEIILKVR